MAMVSDGNIASNGRQSLRVSAMLLSIVLLFSIMKLSISSETKESNMLLYRIVTGWHWLFTMVLERITYYTHWFILI